MLEKSALPLFSLNSNKIGSLFFPLPSFGSNYGQTPYPPATSKWNKIEHRLFSFISINWRAKPLTSLEVVLELISHTTTNEGLTVTAVKDGQTYPTGLKVTDEELAALHLCRNPFHRECNYTIKPQQ